jgi:hypothetical protein
VIEVPSREIEDLKEDSFDPKKTQAQIAVGVEPIACPFSIH